MCLLVPVLEDGPGFVECSVSDLRNFRCAGHWPTLFASFLYFDFCFAVWVLNGAMAPFISEAFHLDAASKGFMVSVPIIAGALMRFPLGVLAQYIGRKNAALVEMGLIVVALVCGFLFVDSYHGVLAMGVLLGIAGASFGVALSLGSGWYPARYKGLAMGIAGAGNSGTVLAVLFAPPLALRFGWSAVYGLAALTMLLPLAVMWFAAKEPPDIERQTLREHVACLFERDGWAFSLVYVVTFGGFIGLASFLPTYFHDQFKVTKVEAGQLTMLATLMGSAVRVAGGWIADRIGGVNTLKRVLLLVAATLVMCGLAGHSLALTTLLFMLCFAALGAGNGALFQLVPLRWPLATAVAGSMIGEIGALGGGFLPNAMGQSQQLAGTYLWGFVAFAVLALAMLAALRVLEPHWSRSWAGRGGRPRSEAAPQGSAA
jgi:MFS transporter, NNP family, nitrate/nitrite transporter